MFPSKPVLDVANLGRTYPEALGERALTLSARNLHANLANGFFCELGSTGSLAERSAPPRAPLRDHVRGILSVSTLEKVIDANASNHPSVAFMQGAPDRPAPIFQKPSDAVRKFSPISEANGRVSMLGAPNPASPQFWSVCWNRTVLVDLLPEAHDESLSRMRSGQIESVYSWVTHRNRHSFGSGPGHIAVSRGRTSFVYCQVTG